MKSILVTGGTGSFGHAFVRRMLASPECPDRLCILSRDEYKQSQMRIEFRDARLRFFLGDVRDRARLEVAFSGITEVIHAAALKQVPAGEYNPGEFIETNVTGSRNVLSAARVAGVKKVLLLSSDKATAPSTLYGATKLMAERLFSAANSIHGCISASTRYGNIVESRGSVIPAWREAVAAGRPIIVTHPEATRFHMHQEQAVDLVLLALREMRGGEVFIPLLKSYRLGDLADVIAGDGYPRQMVGLRESEKLHESLVSEDEMRNARSYGDHLRLLPEIHPWRGEATNGGSPLTESYRSDRCCMRKDELRALIQPLREARA